MTSHSSNNESRHQTFYMDENNLESNTTIIVLWISKTPSESLLYCNHNESVIPSIS